MDLARQILLGAAGVVLIVISGALTYSHLQRLADKGYWGGAWWKISASIACLGVGVALMLIV